jgi:hypothetical protein
MDLRDKLGRVSATTGETAYHMMQLLRIRLAEAQHGRNGRHALFESIFNQMETSTFMRSYKGKGMVAKIAFKEGLGFLHKSMHVCVELGRLHQGMLGSELIVPSPTKPEEGENLKPSSRLVR